MSEVAEILRERLGDAASKVPTRTVPDFLVRAMALFDGGIRSFTGSLGKRTDYDTAKARALGLSPRAIEDSIAESARDLIDRGLVKSAG